jgi:hypothetical protein
MRQPRGEPFQARAIELCLIGHHPIRSSGGYFNRPGLNASFTFACPRLYMTRPSVVEERNSQQIQE